MFVSQTEAAVKARYGKAAAAPEAALCCAVQYDDRYLKAIPAEVIERDYGCGDPSKYLRIGETVLDLGSGTGKIAFIAAQVVGASGRVIGIDMTEEMLEVARRNAPIFADRIGFSNVEFKKGRIQDLALDLELLADRIKEVPLDSTEAYCVAEDFANELRAQSPLVASESIDVVVSNCVLNLVAPSAKRQLFFEIYRVLRSDGRAVISDIVADREVPLDLQKDPELWSGCLSGALTEKDFIAAFQRAGFGQVKVLSRQTEPWQVVEGIEFRSITVEAAKGIKGPFSISPVECCAPKCC